LLYLPQFFIAVYTGVAGLRHAEPPKLSAIIADNFTTENFAAQKLVIFYPCHEGLHLELGRAFNGASNIVAGSNFP
jgi:hypothetical protein